MRRSGWVLCAVLVLCGCGDEPDIIIEQDVIEHVYETVYVEDTTPDVIIVEDTTPDIVYITEEDTTPDVVQEFYSDAADFPALLWNVGGEIPMPKKLRQLNGGVAIKNIVADDGVGVDQDSSGDSMFIEWKNFPLPTNHINGLILSPDAGDPDADVNVTAGKARDATDVTNMDLAAEITKQIDAAWSAGDDAGGMDTGSVAASTLYAVWLIKDQTNELVDVLISLSFSAPTMPTNYTFKRLIGAVKTDATSDIIPFLHSGDEFVYVGNAGTPQPEDLLDSTITAGTWETATLGSVPPLCVADINVSLSNLTETATVGTLYLRTTPTSSHVVGLQTVWASIRTSGTFDVVGTRGRIVVDASQQIDYAATETGGTATVRLYVMGFRMLTRRDPQ